MTAWSYLITRGNKPITSRNPKRPLADVPRAVVILLSFGLALVACAWAEDASSVRLAPAAHSSPRVGERLGFQGRWIGLPIGTGWIEVKEIVDVEGRPAYHIEVQGHTNEVLSTFYPIHDTIHSYLDVDTLKPVRFEKDQREGHYRAHEIVTFDHQRAMATYRSLINGSVKEIALPDTFEDLISALYWFRRQPLQPGRSLSLNVYTDEKIFRTEIAVLSIGPLELLKRGTFSCVVVEPKASFKGLLVKRGRIWAYLTADDHRLPLLVKATTPWGPMSAVLDEASIPPTVERITDASRDSARP